MQFEFSLIVIGGGAAGLSAARTAVGFGKRTLLIEEDRLGGECTWHGCVPSKALIRAAHALWEYRNLDRFQSAGDGPLRAEQPPVTRPALRPLPADWDSLKTLDYVRSVQEAIYAHENPAAVAAWGVTVVKGHAQLTDRHTVTVDGRAYSAKRIVIATGSQSFVPPIPGLNAVPYLTNQTLFSLQHWPSSLVIMGAGPIGVEMAQTFNRLGTAVTLVELAPRILPREDGELAALLQQTLESEGVRILCGAKVVAVRQSAESVAESVAELATDAMTSRIELQYEQGGMAGRVSADQLLVSIGRRARTAGLGLEELGVKIGPTGIAVNKHLRTSVGSIYAVGDCTGIYPLSHNANLQGVTAGLDHALPWRSSADYRHMLWTVFSDPEFARMGLTEDEARERYGSGIRVVRYDISGLDRARCDGVQRAMAKWILRHGKIIGGHILAPRAGELIHQSQAVRHYGKRFSSQSSIIHAYPTYSELHKKAARAALIDGILDHPMVRLFRRR